MVDAVLRTRVVRGSSLPSMSMFFGGLAVSGRLHAHARVGRLRWGGFRLDAGQSTRSRADACVSSCARAFREQRASCQYLLGGVEMRFGFPRVFDQLLNHMQCGFHC